MVGTAGAYLLGPPVVRLLFGPGFDISSATMAILTAASTVYVLAAALSSAAIATGSHRLSGMSWLAGCVTFAAGTALGRASTCASSSAISSAPASRLSWC